MQDDWLDREPGFVATVFQVGRCVRRGLMRPVLVVAIALLLTGGVVAIVALVSGEYNPTYVLRVSEMDGDPSVMPRPKRQLQQYVQEAVFTTEPLMRVIQKHGLYPSLARKNQRAALQSFREDIEVEVYRNYFIEERSREDSPRTARLAVRYRAKDPDLALAVTRELGGLVIEHERQEMRRQAARSALEAARRVERLKSALADRRSDIAKNRLEITESASFDARLEVNLVSLYGSIETLERELEAAQRYKAALDLSSALEKKGVGLHFEVVDDGSLPRSLAISKTELAVLACLIFVFGLPLTALAVGAFSTKRGHS